MQLEAIALLVRDYDEAIRYFTTVLDFELVEDTRVEDDKRWVYVAPRGSATRILLARASTPEQLARVGDQAGGRVLMFLRTDDFDAEYERLSARGVRFSEAPRREPYGMVIVFEDLYGNRWDLLGPA